MTEPTLRQTFEEAGGLFVSDPSSIAGRLSLVRGLVFDWDGVFTSGRKAGGSGSGFSEADSMGLNMLRYGLWRRTRAMTTVAIITGEHNADAADFAAREHLDAVYAGISDKRRAVEHLCEAGGFDRSDVAVVFDDINDLGMADGAGTRFLVRRRASPLLQTYAVSHGLCDYVTGADATTNAVREVAELALGVLGSFDDVVASRVRVDDDYRKYLDERAGVQPRSYGLAGTNIVET